MTYLPAPANLGDRRAFAEAVRTMPNWMGALAALMLANGAVAMAAAWPASWLQPAAHKAAPSAAVVPILTPSAGARKSGCASCGVIETIRRIEATGDLPAAFEFTVRLRDGSLRISSSATQDKWRSGDRIMFLGGFAPPAGQ